MTTTTTTTQASSSSTPISEKEQQKIIDGYQKLRDQQQNVMNELAKLRVEHREHATVLKTMQTLEPDRKCFRQVGDTLIEFKAAELVIILAETMKKFKERMDELEQQMVKHGQELNAYKDKHNIRLLSNKEAMELQKKQALAQISKLDLGTKETKT
uniref:Prefoldin subunit 2 n=2 Tax=Meloidogyne TaxID=189290 RepID=A0A915NL06_9BILA